MTHYDQHLKAKVDCDPELVAARAKVRKLEKELADARTAELNALSRAIAEAQQ